jgi:proteasome lid subunit RPN8/RPN11
MLKVTMQILLPKAITKKLIKALKKAGSREIGGILMGEYISEAVYRIEDITIQQDGGNFIFFMRLIEGIRHPLEHFFQKKDYQFTRFNYLGEWHSHPNFIPEPSDIDCTSMWEIVEDPDVGANFAVLMIVKLNQRQNLEGTVTVFLPGHQMFKAVLVQEQ